MSTTDPCFGDHSGYVTNVLMIRFVPADIMLLCPPSLPMSPEEEQWELSGCQHHLQGLKDWVYSCKFLWRWMLGNWGQCPFVFVSAQQVLHQLPLSLRDLSIDPAKEKVCSCHTSWLAPKAPGPAQAHHGWPITLVQLVCHLFIIIVFIVIVILLRDSSYLPAPLSVCKKWPKHEVFSKRLSDLVQMTLWGLSHQFTKYALTCISMPEPQQRDEGLDTLWDPYCAYSCFGADGWTHLS